MPATDPTKLTNGTKEKLCKTRKSGTGLGANNCIVTGGLEVINKRLKVNVEVLLDELYSLSKQ